VRITLFSVEEANRLLPEIREIHLRGERRERVRNRQVPLAQALASAGPRRWFP